VRWQPSLLDADEPDVDATFAASTRRHLDGTSWVDHVPEWMQGSDTLFEELVARGDWQQPEVHMYDRKLAQPRLSARWPEVPELEALRDVMLGLLSARYDRKFDSVGLNLYRHGRDSVAWHGDRIPEELVQPVVALVSLGERRPFLVRPKGGGTSTRFALGRGDLLVMGGESQRNWQHSVPKRSAAGARLSIALRHSK
jgi:alkylated DNA repair dioxygenase AlkB